MIRRSALVVVAIVVALLGYGQSDDLHAQSTTLLINEIDPNQPGTDTAEFIEIKNVSGEPIELDSYSIVLVNGAGGGASVYYTIDLPSVILGAFEYYVVCSSGSSVTDCDLWALPQGTFQNGDPDALYLNETSLGIIDMVSYGGSVPGFTEGTGAVSDPGDTYEGLARRPDGQDTDDNSIDFSVSTTTPGSSNGGGVGAVGGRAEHSQLQPASASSARGSSSPDSLALAGVAAGGALLLAAGAWGMRRRRTG